MSRIKVNTATNKLATGPVDFPDGITGVAATFTGNVTVGGTIISEDTQNVDAVGWVTARSGLNIGPPSTGIGATIHANGNAVFAGVTTAPTFVGALTGNVTGDVTGNATGLTGNPNIAVTNLDASGTLVEAFSSTTTAWSTTNDLNITNGNLQFCSSNLAGTNNTLDIISTTGINTDLAVGQALNVTAITAVNASTAYVNHITIDGIAVTENWVGGSAPTDGGSSGYDTYTFNILKTGSETFICIANQVKTS
jgi:hypothetical protein